MPEAVRLCRADEIAPGTARRFDVGDHRIALVRIGDDFYAIGDTCSHAGGPLHEGPVSDDCVTCPWHGSVFRLSDGGVVHGPATGPQPAHDVRVVGGQVSVRRRQPTRP